MAAVTGGTGFLGRHLLPALAARGLRLRILTRRDPPPHLHDIELVRGDLDCPDALARLVAGADIVVHAAGLIRARSRREFLAVNRDGASRLAAIVGRASPAAHLIGVSSLAARAPFLSAYAESKRAGEQALDQGFVGRVSIVRPPMIYGPHDRETLGIFRAASRRFVPVPGPRVARIAAIHAADAAAAIAALAARPDGPARVTHALADTNPPGYTPRELLQQAARALGNSPRFVDLPVSAVRWAGRAASLLAVLRGRPTVFGAGKARELSHGQWGVAASELLPPSIFASGVDLARGFESTVAWYRQAGWLRP